MKNRIYILLTSMIACFLLYNYFCWDNAKEIFFHLEGNKTMKFISDDKNTIGFSGENNFASVKTLSFRWNGNQVMIFHDGEITIIPDSSLISIKK